MAENTNNNLENKPEQGKNGGPRVGGGRPKGSLSKKTIDLKEAEKQMKQRVLRSHGKLMSSQMNLARGCQYLYVIKSREITNNKGDVVRVERDKPEIVKDQNKIVDYLAGDLDNEDDEYYYITTEKPDNKSIDSLLDRTFGKARQNIGLDGGRDGEPIAVQAVEKALKGWGNKNIEEKLTEEAIKEAEIFVEETKE